MLAIGALAGGLLSRSAAADIFIESHRDRRPDDASSVIAPLRDELAKAGVTVRVPEVVEVAGEQLPLPGVSDPTLTASYPIELNRQVEIGAKQVFRGDYATGVTTLLGVIKGAGDNPGLVVTDPSAPTWLTKAYAALAFAYVRLDQHDAAIDAVADQYRTFPDNPIGRLVGPAVADLADGLRKTVEALPRGSLRVIVSQPGVDVYVDLRPRGRGRAFVNVVYGKHRLLISRAGVGRQYPILSVPQQDTDLYIDWDADSAFNVTADWLGFVWQRGQEDRTYLAVSRYARAGRKHKIIVAGIVERAGRRFLSGGTFEARTGSMVRHKAIVIGGDDLACKRALARYLLQGDTSDCLIDLPSDDEQPRETPKVPRDGQAMPGILAGVGASAVIGGAVVTITKEDRTGQPRQYVSWPGAGLVVGGGLAIGVSIYWATRISRSTDGGSSASPRSNAPLYVAAGTGIAALVGGGYLLHVDGMGSCGLSGPGECRYLNATATLGWVSIGLGVAATGAGLYWRFRPSGVSRPPTVSVSPTAAGAMAIITGTF